MSEPTCKICHRATPPGGRQVCDQCMGFERVDCSTKAECVVASTTEPQAGVDPPLAICNTCGTGFASYKLGRNTVREGICHACVMRKKYGPDWVPGGSKAKKKVAMQKANEMLLCGENGPEHDKPTQTGFVSHHNAEGSFHGDFMVRLLFDTRDQALYRKIQEISNRERRTMEQQILWFVERTLDLAHSAEA